MQPFHSSLSILRKSHKIVNTLLRNRLCNRSFGHMLANGTDLRAFKAGQTVTLGNSSIFSKFSSSDIFSYGGFIRDITVLEVWEDSAGSGCIQFQAKKLLSVVK